MSLPVDGQHTVAQPLDAECRLQGVGHKPILSDAVGLVPRSHLLRASSITGPYYLLGIPKQSQPSLGQVPMTS